MLRELLYEMLMSMTNFVRGTFFLESLFDIERNIFGRLLVKASNLVGWILAQLFLISITGGLYLVWIGFKLIFRSMRRKHNKKQTRKNKRRA